MLLIGLFAEEVEATGKKGLIRRKHSVEDNVIL